MDFALLTYWQSPEISSIRNLTSLLLHSFLLYLRYFILFFVIFLLCVPQTIARSLCWPLPLHWLEINCMPFMVQFTNLGIICVRKCCKRIKNIPCVCVGVCCLHRLATKLGSYQCENKYTPNSAYT